MKKLYYRLLLTVIVLASVMPFIMKGSDGRPLMAIADLKMPSLNMPGKKTVSTLISTTRGDAPVDAKEGVITVYRWQDDQGIWHFSDDSNPQGQSEAMKVQVNAGVVNTTPVTAVESDLSLGPDVDTLLDPGFISVLHAGEALDQARNVEKVLQQRYQRQEQMLSR